MLREFLAYVFAIPSVLRARKYQGQKVIELPFKVAGGKIVKLPVTKAGAIPAETSDVRIDVAGISVQPSKENPNQSELIWHFGFTNKQLKCVRRVSVIEIAPSRTETTRIEDAAPSLKDNYWLGVTGPVEATAVSIPWLFEEKTSMFVFRFTIEGETGLPIELYQPTFFSAEAKAIFRKLIANNSQRVS
jgi:hypothetical protein